jgi:hypothetical protein
MSDDTHKNWWAPIRNGLVTDPRGKHIKAMGPALPLYLYLHIFADREKGRLFRKYQTISEHMGVPVSTLKKWMKRLKSGGYVELTSLGDGLSIQITKFRPIRSTKSGQEKYQIEQGEVPDSTRGIKVGTSSSDSKQNGNHACSSNNGTSKESIKESNKDIYRIFKFWNSQKIIQHREFEKFKPHIQAKLKSYTMEEIIVAIQVYKKVLDSPDHYFTHEWTLKQFLTQANGMDRFLNEDKALVNFAKRNGNGYRNQAEINSASSGEVVT